MLLGDDYQITILTWSRKGKRADFFNNRSASRIPPPPRFRCPPPRHARNRLRVTKGDFGLFERSRMRTVRGKEEESRSQLNPANGEGGRRQAA